jgi:hypothetical protein
LLCFGALIWALIIVLILLYLYTISNLLPSFIEIKKLRLKKNNEDNLMKQTILINRYLQYNIKLKKFC